MSGTGRGILTISVILFVALFYWLFFVYKVPSSTSTTDRGMVADYLQTKPEIQNTAARMQTGQPAPDFMFATTSNHLIKLSDYKGKKPVVIDFFATWCGPCLRELPALQAFYQQYSDKVEIIAISAEDARASGEIKSLVQSNALSFPVMHEYTRAVDSMYPHQAIPFLVFIDKDGKVVNTVVGYDPNVGEEILSTFGLK